MLMPQYSTHPSRFLTKSARSWRFRPLDRVGWIQPLRCQSASLGVQQQNPIDGVDFVFRQSPASSPTNSGAWSPSRITPAGG
jgi:hypothetical protein